MKHHYLKYAALIAAPLLLSGCVDDNYDLSDIDTTTRIPIRNLSVGLKFESIKLDDVIDLDDNENICVTEIDGKKIYAIQKSGTFTSDDVSIDPVHVNAPHINSTNISLSASGILPVHKRAIDLDNLKVSYDIHDDMLTDFSFATSDIDPALISVNDLTSHKPITLTISFYIPQSLANNVGKISFSNVKLKLPQGLYMADGKTAARLNLGSYDPISGIATLNETVETNGYSNKIEVILEAGMLNAKVADINIVNHAIDYHGQAGLLKGGHISLTPNLEHITLPTSFDLSTDYSITSFDVATISGEVDYNIKGIEIDPIELTDLPDFLNDPETDITLVNPQIYLGAKNTTADYHTGLSGRIALDSKFSNGEKQAVSPPFTIGWENGPVDYNIAMATDIKNLDLLDKYPGATTLTYEGLNTILSSPDGAAGLPKRIGVSLDNLHFYGNAVNFPIKQNDGSNFGVIPSTTGEYTFYAPLSMTPGSTIVYAKTEDGISDDDGMEDISINSLKLTANAITNIPFSIKLDLVVMNKDGKRLGKSNSVNLQPNANSPITIIVESTSDSPITDIDAVQYRARIVGTNDSRPLSPDQYIKLENIKLTVDGYIETDF